MSEYSLSLSSISLFPSFTYNHWLALNHNFISVSYLAESLLLRETLGISKIKKKKVCEGIWKGLNYMLQTGNFLQVLFTVVNVTEHTERISSRIFFEHLTSFWG